MHSEPTIVKVGGSLLDLPDLGMRLLDLVALTRTATPLLIVGGGGVVEELRRLDGIHNFPPETTHRLALAGMSMTADLVAALHPRFRVSDSVFEARTLWDREMIPIFDCRKSGLIDDLSATWDITSDSIAACIALRCRANRLILAKSIPLPAVDLPMTAAVSMQLIDPQFPVWGTAGFSLGWCNLRESELRIQPWHPRPDDDVR